MKDTEKELTTLLEALRIEMEEDKRQYLEKMVNTSLQQRKEEGVTWYPVAIKDSYYGMGERLLVEVERTTGKELPHQFQTGKTVSLFTNQSEERGDGVSIAGVITSIVQDVMKITFFVDELPDWVDRGKLGVDLLFDETSYKEMENVIQVVKKARNNRLAELREVLLGAEQAQEVKHIQKVSIAALNESQNLAVNKVLQAEDVAIIHGPPGTGKTTTLIECICQVLKEEEQVLVCAPSNTAIDLITEKLAQKDVRVLRIGNPARVNEEQLQHTVDVQLTSHRDYKLIKELRKKAAELRVMGTKYKRHFGKQERDQRKLLLNEARKMNQEAAAIENHIIHDLLENAQVITCTLVGSVNHMIRDRNYRTVFIDEAAQALEPATWIPITKAERVVFAGDHWQLPPTVKSMEAARKGLIETLFEKTIQRQKVDVMLETQYRMHNDIMGFSNTKFYQGALKAHESVANRVLAEGDEHLLSQPVEFIDTAGCGYEEQVEAQTLSTYNEEEAALLLKHLHLLYETMQSKGLVLQKIRTGIITPYKAQKERLKELLGADELLQATGSRISVNTVDGFQGQERDIIYISMVRSNSIGEIGFLGDVRRMNVALTRAKKKLVVIGDTGTLVQHPFYKDFFDYIEKIGAYKSAWEYIY